MGTSNHLLNLKQAPILVLVVLLSLLSACGREPEPAPEPEATVVAEIPVIPAAATWTPVPQIVQPEAEEPATLPPPATSTPFPTATPLPATNTPEATDTPTPTETPLPTDTPTPAPTQPPRPTSPPAPPTVPPNAEPGPNILPNPSFEEGHYNQNGIAELQLPNGWRVEYREDATGFGNQAWDVYVRPEIRVLSQAFLPPEEHPLYIFDGGHTVKLFKGTGAISARLVTDVTLEPGTYVLEANFFSDVFERFEDRRKIPPQDPSAGEASLSAGTGGTGWIGNQYLQRNQLTHTFTVNETQTIPVGVGFRGRYAIANNGWFVDNLSLRRLQ